MATLIASQPRIFWTCLAFMLCNISAVFSQCEIQSVVVDSVLCNDNGTPSDPSDDFISFQAMVDGTNTADEYSISSDNGTVSSNFGTYGTTSYFLISNFTGDPTTLTFIDRDDPQCTFEYVLPAIGPSCECDLHLAQPSGYVMCIDGLMVYSAVVWNGGNDGTFTADDPWMTMGSLHETFWFGPFPPDTNIVTITWDQNPACQFNFTVINNCPDSCCQSCFFYDTYITESVCNDNGTPGDPSDDTYTIELYLNGVGISPNGWTADDPLSSSGQYHTPVTLGPYLIADGNFNLTITDADDSSCDYSWLIEPPAACSDGQCEIQSVVLDSVLCDDNGTTGNPSDDFISFQAMVNGMNTANGYSITSSNGTVSPNFGTYGTTTYFQILNVTGDSTTLTFTDQDDPQCTFEYVLPAIGPSCDCSNPGTGAAGAFPVLIDGAVFWWAALFNGGSAGTFTADDSSMTTGVFGATYVFGPFPPCTPSTMTITWNENPTCQGTILFDAVFCGGTCSIDPLYITVGACNDNGTPADPSDDTFTIELHLTGSFVSPDGWTANDPLSSSGQYDTPVTLGPYLIANGGFTLIITDADDPSCTYTETIVPPAACSDEQCEINIPQISNIACNDNGTPGDPGDDYIDFILTATGTAVASTYTISASSGSVTPSTGAYGSSIAFSTSPGTAGAGDITLTLIDDDDNQCQVTTELPDPGVCSMPVCMIDDATVSNISCNDNGTASDPSDDYIDFTLTVSGMNTGSGYTVTASSGVLTPPDGDYGVPVSFSTSPGTAGAGAIVLTVTDVVDDQCQLSVNLDDPGACSDACEINAELLDMMCDNNGTPQTSADDIYVITVLVSGVNNGPGWEITSPVIASGLYDVPTQIGPLSLASSVDLEFIDLSDPLCIATLTVGSASGCSSGCAQSDSTFVQAVTCDENDAGTTSQVLTNAVGCDSVVITETVLLPADTTYVLAQTCNPPDTGILVEAFVNGSGCDSTVITETVLLPGDTTYLQSQSCNPGDTGVIVQILTNGEGCDSTVITVTVLMIGDTTYLQSQSCNPADTGIIVQILTNAGGCDSIVVEEVLFNMTNADSTYIFSQTCDSLQVGTFTDTLVNESGCDSLVFRETIYSTADTTILDIETCDPADTASTVEILVNDQGCDSVVITQADLLPSDTSWVAATTCIPAEAGISTQVLQNAQGCDSVVITERQLLESDTMVMTVQTCDPDDAGIATDTFVNIHGCDSVVITEKIFAGSDTTFFAPTLCSEDSILVNDTYYSNMLPEGTETFQNAEGCDSIVAVSLNFRDDPQVRYVDTLLCPGESIEIEGEIFNADNPSGTRIFQYQGTDCDSLVIDIIITIDSLLADVEAISPPCAGAAGTVVVHAVSGGTGPYEISLNNAAPVFTMGFPVTIPSDSTGTNVIGITDARGCSAMNSVEIAEAAVPQILIDSVIVIEEGTEVRLQPEVSFPYDSIVWSPGDGLSCTDCLQPVVTGGVDRIVSVTASSLNGCTASANILLVFSRQSEIYAPNVFSPNDDGVNDYFTLFTDAEDSMILRMSVFDRWGNQVFERKNFPANLPGEGWDGRYDGTLPDPGVYIFSARVRGHNGRVIKLAGDVTLIR